MIFPVLYKRNVNGSINCWEIHVDGNEYFTKFGKLGGTIQTSDRVQCFPKNIGKVNETTAEKQAELEANSIWQRKIDIENFSQDLEKVDELKFNPPMLAKVYSKKYTNDIKFIQPKLDGVRCNISLNKESGELISLSRRNKPFYSTEHIKESLHGFLKTFPDIHLDGELYNHELHDNFNKIVSLVKKQKLSSSDENAIRENVKYYIYDLWSDKDPLLNFGERSKIIRELLKNVEFVEVVPTYEVNSEEDVEKYFREFLSNGYEGAILRLDAPYEHKRSKNLLKYKEFSDDEFEILSVNVGKTNLFAESFTIKLKNGNICNATLAFPDEECKQILDESEKYIGKNATVCFFGYTNDGMLRFPVVKSIDRGEYE